MKKMRLSVLTAFMMGGILFAQNTRAQNGPCGWDITSTVAQPTCDKLCNGSVSVVPTVNWPYFEYLWSNGNATNTINNLCADVYTLTVTDDKKCSQTYTFTLVDPVSITASCTTLANETWCGAGDGSIEASATGGDGNYTYEWQTAPVVSGAVLSNMAAGTYSVIVTDGNDCTATTSCTITCEKKDDCDGFRTQTQGGWGQCQQNGNNPGTYLAANFDGAFPNDLTIGCTRTLTLTSSQAVCDFLPSGTSPKMLPVGTLVDPGATYKNVFAGQLVAATLNVQFDLYDVNFGASTVNLGDLEIAVGPFAGWSVNALLQEANNKIGGCGSSYSHSNLSAALDSINNNFVDGTADNGFLICPEKKDVRVESSIPGQMSVSVYPNPASGNTSISVTVIKDDALQIDVYNIAGQKTATLFKGEVKAQDGVNLNLDAASMDAGIYFIKVISSEKVFTYKFIVKK